MTTREHQEAELRPAITAAWDQTFYLLTSTEEHWHTRADDVHDAIALWLERQVKRGGTIPALLGVRLELMGDWCTFPIGTAYRRCKPVIQQAVRRAIEREYPGYCDDILTGDVADYEQWLTEKQSLGLLQ